MRLLVVFLLCLFSFDQTVAQWGKLVSNTRANLNTVHFVNSDIGYFAGDSGMISKTTDAGAKWTDISITDSIDIKTIFFTDQSIGYMVGSKSTFLKTIDGGQSWTFKYASTINMNDLFFIDANTGTIVGDNGLILKTTNGGNNWSLIPSGIIYFLTSVYFPTNDTGYAAGSNGSIIKTTDSGDNWLVLTTPTTEIISDIHFSDAYTGYFVGKNGIILKTTDGGSSFITLNNGSSDWITGISSFVDTTYLIGLNGRLFVSKDDTNWTTQKIDSVNWFNGVYFTNNYVGYAVGSNGVLIKTCPFAQFTVSNEQVDLANDGKVTFTNNTKNYTSVNWDFGDGNISENYDAEHTYTTEGVYNVKLKAYNESDCVDSVSVQITVTNSLGIYNTRQESNIKLYPNPFKDDLNLFFTLNRNALVKLDILNCFGQLVKSFPSNFYIEGQHQIPIDFSEKLNVSRGMYYSKLIINDKEHLQKLFYLGD
ncbi:MAG: hypothetical protein COC01_04870 [Bacteroidetes bacterium]|nr:PKD domain-containing protein [Sphingobacteriaceae bacterium AH-315-L07]PCH67904.1 MAG: hypothetical protein COC01_04870 [Bacteroidota bacterium]